MKFKHLLMSGMIAALAGFFVVGCNENPDDPGDGNDSTQVSAITGLQAVSMSSTSVGLSWNASTTSGATYRVSWRVTGQAELGNDVVETTSVAVTGLTEGTKYTFTITAIATGSDDSDPVSIEWSPATRHVADARTTGVIRIYEKAATGADKGSGLILDPALGGPRNESVASGTLGSIQLAAEVEGNRFKIGPSHAPAFETVFQNWADFPNNVMVSDNYYQIDGDLDDWMMNTSLDALFTTNRKEAYVDVPNQLSGNKAMAFAVRIGTGTPGVFKYARVLVVPGTDGKLVQNDGNNYVVLHVSFQSVAGVPYAKPN